MEMYGMDQGRDHSNYGKLADDDEVRNAYHAFLIHSSLLEQDERAPLNANTETLDERTHAYRSRSKALPPPLAPRPQQRRKSTNPFDYNRDAIDGLVDLNSDVYGHRENDHHHNGDSEFGAKPPLKQWQTYSGTSDAQDDPWSDYRKQKPTERSFDNPWAKKSWNVNTNGGIQSPVSSKGTRDSAGSTTENPFQ